MKRIYILFATIAVLLSSCSDWLDVQPSDTVSADKMFEVGTGYRIALNGVYKKASTGALYGKELVWGLLSACGGDYDQSYYGIGYYHPYAIIASDYDYTNADAIKVFDPIWENAYNCIANCNNLIGNIRNEDPSKFQKGEIEKNLIMGEAYALRAMLHFDILRMYAPAKDDGKTYIPYYDQDGLSTGQPALKVDEVLSKVVDDLEMAQKMVIDLDVNDEAHRYLIYYGNRFEMKYHIDIPVAERDPFFACRAYRMNYFAVTAILARVYNYMGDHTKAYEEAKKVLDYNFDDAYGYPFIFTVLNAVDNNKKTREDIIFCLSDPKLYDAYHPYSYYKGGAEAFLALNSTITFDDPGDYRKTKLIGTGDYSKSVSLKFVRPASETSDSKINADILPIVRLSEMYYIKAEYEASKGLYEDAAKSMDMVRMGRNCTAGRLSFNSQATFEAELLKEARREFVAEGQTYFYYKKLGVLPSRWMTEEHFVFPKPIAEDVQI